MSQKVFKGEELPGGAFECDVVFVGEYDKVLEDATDHVRNQHDPTYDSNVISQTIRDYNESTDGQPQGCSHN